MPTKKTPVKAKKTKVSVKAKTKPKPKTKLKSKSKKTTIKKESKPSSKSTKKLDIPDSTPEIKSLSNSSMLPSTKPVRTPVLKNSLVHKPNLITGASSPRLISDIKAPNKSMPTKRLKLAPIHLPLDSVKPNVPKQNSAPEIALKPSLDPAPISSHSPVSKPDTTAALLPDEVLPTIGKPSTPINSGDLFDDILDEANKEDEGPVYDRNYSQPPEKDISIGEAEELYSEIGMATSAEEVSIDEKDDQSDPAQESPSGAEKEISHHHHLPIKDRHKKSKYVYVFEILIILGLIIFFFSLLIDAQIIDLGFELPFDFI